MIGPVLRVAQEQGAVGVVTQRLGELRQREIGGGIFLGHGNVAVTAALMFRHVTEFEIIRQRVAFVGAGARGADRGVGRRPDQAGQGRVGIEVRRAESVKVGDDGAAGSPIMTPLSSFGTPQRGKAPPC